MDGEARVRPYRTADHAAVVVFLRDTFAALGRELLPDGKDTDVRDLNVVYSSATGGAFFLLEAAGRIVGTAGIRRIDPSTGELERLYISERWRGRGFGTALCAAVLAEAVRLGYSRVRLDTTLQSAAAIATFTRLGFTPIDRYNDNPFAELFFEKRLAECA